MPKILSFLWALFWRFKADMAYSACGVGSNANIVARGVPCHEERRFGHSIDAKDAVLPIRPGECSIKDGVAKLTVKIIEQDNTVAGQRQRRDPLAKFVFVTGVGRDGESLARGNARNAVE